MDEKRQSIGQLTASDAADVLREGGLVALPTETVYGLAADAANGEAVASIYETKGRPSFNPLIVHVLNEVWAENIVDLDNCARKLISAFWPGPLTLVLPRRENAPISELASAGLPTLAIRSPGHETARDVLEHLERPFVAPSANRSGRISPTTADHVFAEFQGDVPILDGGPCQDGIESTIISLTHSRPTLLRPGSLSPAEIEAVLGHPLGKPGDGIEAPGMMSSHYAPNAQVQLDATTVSDEGCLLGFGGTPGATLDLSPDGDLKEAAANLFAYLRLLDAKSTDIAVAPIPETGIGIAINDRLRRAAAPRGQR